MTGSPRRAPAERPDPALVTVGLPGGGRGRLRAPFLAATLFFLVFPFISLVTDPPAELAAFALLLAGWAIFALTVVVLFRGGPFARPYAGPWMVAAVIAMTGLAVAAQVGFGTAQGSALYFYAGVTAARLGDERLAIGGISLVSLAALLALGIGANDWATAIVIGVTVATISLTLYSQARLGRANRELDAARRDLAELAVAEERARIARDLHDTLGHSLSLIALKSELARRVLADDPDRAASEIADVERVAREALASVRETVSGYRQPTLAIELAGARSALAAAGIEGDVEPAPDGLPRDVDAVLGWAVREGVTNVLRHSEAANARIRVTAEGEVCAVEVVDDGIGHESHDGRPGTGIAGLRERASGLGGSVEAGPLPDRGFRLRVALPIPVPDPAGAGAA